MREALTQLVLLNRNVTGMHGIGALSFAHTKKDITSTKEIIEEIAFPVMKSNIK